MPYRARARGPLVIVLAIGLFMTAATVGRATTQARASTPPNIVLILTDDQRWDTLWAMPQVDSLIADHGVTFENSFVVNPLCCPSRASILSGQYSHSTGVYKNAPPNGGFGSFHDTSTLATWLHDDGYQTALMGKYLNGYHDASYIPPGWDRWFASTTHSTGGFEYYDYTMSDQGTEVAYGSDPEDYSTTVLQNEADSWIRGADPAKPLFLDFAVAAPHLPSTPAPPYVGAFSDLAPYRPPNFNELDMSDKAAYLQQTPLIDQATQDDLDATVKDQYRTLLSVDDAVSSIVQALSDTGRLSNTMIVFASDNGYSWGEHRRERRKSDEFEEDIRVPLIIRYDPLTSSPSTDSHLVANIDWAPTFADLAGVPSPGADGTSLMPLIEKQQVTWRTDFAVEHLQGTGDEVDSYCTVRNEGYAYTKFATGEEELFDLTADPWELENKSKDPSYASILAQMAARAVTLCNPPPPGFTFASTPPTMTISSEPPAVTTSKSATFAFSGNESMKSTGCALDGAVPQACSSPITYSNLPVGDHVFSVIGTDQQNYVGTAAWHWTVAAPVTVKDFAFQPAITKPNYGNTVLWSNIGPSTHTVTDATGMGLFDSGPIPNGGTFSFPFTAAGIYTYHCTIHTQMQGQAKVPITVSPTSGDVTTVFTIGWASVTAPAGYRYETQIKRPGSTTWSTWFAGSDVSQTFVPDAGTGTYQFRSRLKNTGNGAASNWSNPKYISVT